MKLYVRNALFGPFFAESSNVTSGSPNLRLAQWEVVNLSGTYWENVAVPGRIAHLRMGTDQSRAL